MLPKYHVAIMVDGCFWHSHFCPRGRRTKPITGPNAGAWLKKFARVKEREAEAASGLSGMGYRVVRIWECEITQDLPSALYRATEFARLHC